MTDYQKRQIVGALPTGDNAIGKLAANNGVDIGDVDVKSIAAGDNNIGNVDVVTLPVLPTGTNTIGSVKITDGIETATVNASNFLETSPEHSLKGKTMIYSQAWVSDGWATARTVTAGKTYYCICATLSYYATSNLRTVNLVFGSAGNVVMLVKSNVNATYHVNDAGDKTVTFPHPIPVAAGEAIRIYSNNAGITGFVHLTGWEE